LSAASTGDGPSIYEVYNDNGAPVKRSRRGGRRPQSSHNGHSTGGGGGGGNSHNLNRTYDSNGPEIKIRGSAAHVYEKYLQRARDAITQGDRVMAENYLQHAEHYFRILAAIQAQQQQYAQNNPQMQQQPNTNGNGQYRQPNGSGEQPYVPGAMQAAGPSFSLADSGNVAESEEDVAE
jgi:Domain of unknown function (DUF4167)